MFKPNFNITPALKITRTPRLFFKNNPRFTSFLKFNYLLALYKFNFLYVFWFSQKKKINIKNQFKNKLIFKKLQKKTPSYFFNFYKQLFYNKFYPLTGLGMSPQFSDLRDKKQWIRKDYKFRLRTNYKFLRTFNLHFFEVRKQMKTLKNFKPKRLTLKYLKYFYYNNMFFCFKWQLNYRSLKNFTRLIKSNFPVHANRHPYFKPYFFFNNIETNFNEIDFPLKHVFALFKSYKKLFRVLKRRNRKTWNWVSLWFKNYSNTNKYLNNQLILYPSYFNVKSILNKIRRFKKIKIIKLFFIKNIKIEPKPQKRKMRKIFKLTWKKYYLFNAIRYLRRSNTNRRLQTILKRLVRIKRLTKKPRFFFINLPYYSYRIFKISQTFNRLRFRRYRYHWRALRRFKKWYVWFLLNQKQNMGENLKKTYKLYRFFLIQSSNIFKKIFKQQQKNLVFSHLRFRHNIRKLTQPFFFRIYPHHNPVFFFTDDKFIQFNFNSFNHQTQKKPLLTSRHDCTFISSSTNFLMLTNTLFINYLTKNGQYSYTIKKLIYNFPAYEQMTKHILKKYNRFRISAYWTKTLKKTKKLFFKKFYNPTRRELIIKSNQFRYNLNTPISNLKTLLSNQELSLSPIPNQNYWKKKNPLKRWLNLFIRRVRLKPGYMRLWRRARFALLKSLQVRFVYQHRLTRFLIDHKKASQLKFLPLFEMQLFNVLMRTRFVLDIIHAKTFIENKLVYINGVCCSNSFLQVFTNDFIQIVLTLKYYITFRWLLNSAVKIKKNLKQLAWKSKQNKSKQVGKYVGYNLPKNVQSHKHLLLDVARYMEIDFFTLSAFILYDPFLWNDLNHYHGITVRHCIFNVYNWKYIT